VETFGRTMESAEAGDNVALLLRGVQRGQVRRGQVVAVPGSTEVHTAFTARLHLLDTAQGGRRTGITSGYRPQFYLRTGDVVGNVELPDGTGLVLPGQTVEAQVTLGQAVPLEPGLTFAVREGGRTVAAGAVLGVTA
jgi:elongation factor Tu